MKLIRPHSLREQEPDPARLRKFARSFVQARRELLRLSDLGAANMRRLVLDMGEEIRDRLLFFRPGDIAAPFGTNLIPQISTEINRAIEELVRRGGLEIGVRMADSFNFGQGVTARALQAAAVDIAAPAISPELLTTLANRSFDIFSDTGAALQARLTRELQLGTLGLTPASGVSRRIQDIIARDVLEEGGLRRRIGFQAQADEITRLEIGRSYSSAQQLASEQMADTIPGMGKKWVTVGGVRVRQGHRDIEHETADNPIPIRARFRVVDHSRVGRSNFLTLGGRHQPPQGAVPALRVVKPKKSFTRRGRLITDNMLHPRDPAASPGNVLG